VQLVLAAGRPPARSVDPGSPPARSMVARAPNTPEQSRYPGYPMMTPLQFRHRSSWDDKYVPQPRAGTAPTLWVEGGQSAKHESGRSDSSSVWRQAASALKQAPAPRSWARGAQGPVAPQSTETPTRFQPTGSQQPPSTLPGWLPQTQVQLTEPQQSFRPRCTSADQLPSRGRSSSNGRLRCTSANQLPSPDQPASRGRDPNGKAQVGAIRQRHASEFGQHQWIIPNSWLIA